jgi:hypothetical protein
LNLLNISENFTLDDLHPDNANAFVIDTRMISLLEELTKFFKKKPNIVNYQTPMFNGYGEEHHNTGSACDISIEGRTPTDVFKLILANVKRFKEAGLTAMQHPSITGNTLHISSQRTSKTKVIIYGDTKQ